LRILLAWILGLAAAPAALATYNPNGLKGGYACTYALTTTQAIANADNTQALSGYTKIFDNAETTGAAWYSAGSPTRFTVPATAPTGTYLVMACIDWPKSGANSHCEFTKIYKNGSFYLSFGMLDNNATSGSSSGCMPLIMSLTAGDYIEVYGYQASGVSVTILGTGAVGGDTSYVSITYLPGQ